MDPLTPKQPTDPPARSLFMGTPSIGPSVGVPSTPPSGPVPTEKKKRPWRSIKARREQYGSSPGCVPAWYASLYQHLPWRWYLTLTAPPGKLGEYWDRWWAELGQWDRVSDYGEVAPDPPRLRFTEYGVPGTSLGHVRKSDREMVDRRREALSRAALDAFPFWLAVEAKHEVSKRARAGVEAPVEPGVPHVHMLVGGLSYQRVRALEKAWPGRYSRNREPLYKLWSLIHYVLAQARPDEHRADAFSYCNSLVRPPLESWNLDAVLISHQHRERRRRKRKRKRRKGSTRGRRRSGTRGSGSAASTAAASSSSES